MTGTLNLGSQDAPACQTVRISQRHSPQEAELLTYSESSRLLGLRARVLQRLSESRMPRRVSQRQAHPWDRHLTAVKAKEKGVLSSRTSRCAAPMTQRKNVTLHAPSPNGCTCRAGGAPKTHTHTKTNGPEVVSFVSEPLLRFALGMFSYFCL